MKRTLVLHGDTSKPVGWVEVFNSYRTEPFIVGGLDCRISPMRSQDGIVAWSLDVVPAAPRVTPTIDLDDPVEAFLEWYLAGREAGTVYVERPSVLASAAVAHYRRLMAGVREASHSPINQKPPTTMEDGRPITMLTFPFQDADQPSLTIGCTLFGAAVTRIVPYEEPGEMAPVLWYAIYGRKEIDTKTTKGSILDAVRDGITVKAEELLYRIQAKYVEAIGYQEEGA